MARALSKVGLVLLCISACASQSLYNASCTSVYDSSSLIQHKGKGKTCEEAAGKAPCGLDDLVAHLNKLYKEGKPSKTASKAGIALRMGIPLSWKYPGPQYQTTIAASLINDAVSRPANDTCDIAVYPTWILSGGDGIHVPVGVIYAPCAVDKAMQCSYPLSARTNERYGKTRCARYNINYWFRADKMPYPNFFPKLEAAVDECQAGAGNCTALNSIFADPLCSSCFFTKNYLSEANNTATNQDVFYVPNLKGYDPAHEYPQDFPPGDGSNNTPPSATTSELELLFNRQNFMTASQTAYSWPNCSNCITDIMGNTETPPGTAFSSLYRFYESPGFYGGLDGKTPANNEFDKMLQTQEEYFSAKTGPCPTDADIGLYNELALNEAIIDALETGRSFDTDFDGRVNGECRAGITAIFQVCGKKYPKPDYRPCIKDYYMTGGYKNDRAPPLVWFNLNNLDKPFSSTCDDPDPCIPDPS